MKVAIRIVIGSAALIAALTSALASSALAASSAPSAALMAPIETAFDALNTTNEAMWNSAYTSDAVIIDDFAPYRWDAPGASAKWWAGFQAGLKNVKQTQPHIAHQPIQFWQQTGDRAYVVVPTTFTLLQNGKPFTETGIWTMTLMRTGTTWKIHGWGWGTT